jgi:hypothetical protein
MTARHAALESEFSSHRRAEGAKRYSWTVPAAMTRPRAQARKRRQQAPQSAAQIFCRDWPQFVTQLLRSDL